MEGKSEEKLRGDFRDLLIELSDPEVDLEDSEVYDNYINRFENLYNSDCHGVKFRHYYSDIFQVLTTIKSSERLNNIETLGVNITHLKNEYQPKEGNIDITHNLRKLLDHVNLDMARLEYSDGADWKLSHEQRFKDIDEKIFVTGQNIHNISADIVKLHDEVENTAKKLDRSQREYVAVLGIFSSVVLTFIGGIGFSSAVLEAMNCVSIYRLLLIVDGLAAVLLNMICFLMGFIYQIVKDEMPTFIKVQKMMNIVFAIIAAIIIVAWVFHLDGLRDLIGTIGSTLFS